MPDIFDDDPPIEEFTFSELSIFIDDQRALMSEEERYQRNIHCDPTFYEWVFSCISPGDVVLINDAYKIYEMK